MRLHGQAHTQLPEFRKFKKMRGALQRLALSCFEFTKFVKLAHACTWCYVKMDVGARVCVMLVVVSLLVLRA